MTIVVTVKKTADIAAAEVDRMADLFVRFTNISKEEFPSRLYKYDQIGMAYKKNSEGNGVDKNNLLVGFIGYNVRRVPRMDDPQQQQIVSIYIGITALAPEVRRCGIVQRIVWRAIGQAYWQYPFCQKYVWTHCRSYKPYLFFARWFQESYPTRRQTDNDAPHVTAIRDSLLAAQGEDLGQQGWVSTKPTERYIIDQTVHVQPHDLEDPDIRFYHDLCPNSRCGVYAFFPVNLTNAVADGWHELEKLCRRFLAALFVSAFLGDYHASIKNATRIGQEEEEERHQAIASKKDNKEQDKEPTLPSVTTPLQELFRDLTQAMKQEGGIVGPAQAAEMVQRRNIQREDLLPYAKLNHPPGDNYGRTLVHSWQDDNSGALELMVMSWNPGHYSSIHDHGNSEWGVVQVFGSGAHHLAYAMDHENVLDFCQKEVLANGATVLIDQALIHQMGNQHASDALLSLHIYGTNERRQPAGGVTANARTFEIEFDRIGHTSGGAFFNANDIYDFAPGPQVSNPVFFHYTNLLMAYYERQEQTEDIVLLKQALQQKVQDRMTRHSFPRVALDNDSSPIGICDWGVGGLGVLKELRQRGIARPVLYLSDNGATPYGKLSHAALLERLTLVMEFFERRGVQRVVIACNAASTVKNDLQSLCPKQEIVGVPDPTILALSRNHPSPLHIGIIGGSRTIASEIYVRGLTHAGHRVSQSVAQPLSALIEKGKHADDPCGFKRIAEPIVRPLRSCDVLVLGCTHYPAATSLFTELMPGVKMCDPAIHVVDCVQRSWNLKAQDASKTADGDLPNDWFMTTGSVHEMRNGAKKSFGIILPSERTHPVNSRCLE